MSNKRHMLKRRLNRLQRSERGAGLVDYGILIGFLAIVEEVGRRI